MSTPRSPFALSDDGTTIAAGDGPELLVWKGDGSPAWKQFLQGIIVDILVTTEHVLALDADGRLSRFARGDGEPLGDIHTAPFPLQMAAARDGTLGVLTREGLRLLRPHGETLLPTRGATTFAFGPDGASVGLGRSDGSFDAVEIQSGAAWGSLTLPSPVVAIGWSALGHWIVGAGQVLYRIRGDASAIEAQIPGADHPIEGLTVSSSGLVVAARAGEHVELYELYRNKPLGEFVLRRSIGDVRFGLGLQLGIGLDDGDGNVIELSSAASWRTEPHPGRGRNTWRLENKVDLAAVRGAIALHQAGGQPIARYVPPPSEAEPPASTRSRLLAGCAGIFTLIVTMSLLCGGFLLFIYFWRASGLWELVPIR